MEWSSLGVDTLVVLFLPLLSQACSPGGVDIWDIPDHQKAHHYEDILYGKVLATYPDPRFDYGGGSDVYTAKMKVYCIYKGNPVPAVVNITEAGFVAGHCHANDLQENKEYIVMVMRLDTRLKVLFAMEATAQVKHNVTRACQLTLSYPSNVAADTVDCPVPASTDQCQPDPRATPKPDPTTSPKTVTYKTESKAEQMPASGGLHKQEQKADKDEKDNSTEGTSKTVEVQAVVAKENSAPHIHISILSTITGLLSLLLCLVL